MFVWLPRQRHTLHLVSSTRPIFRHTNTHSFLQRSLATHTNPEKPTPTQTPTAPLPTRVWKKVKHEAQHYWHGSKLLVSDVRIASKLQWKILHGDALTRRERRQVSVCIVTHPIHFAPIFILAQTNHTRPPPSHPLRCICHRTIHGVPPPRCFKAFPKHVTFHFRG